MVPAGYRTVQDENPLKQALGSRPCWPETVLETSDRIMEDLLDPDPRGKVCQKFGKKVLKTN